MNLNALITVREAADKLGVTTNHIRLLLATDKLKGEKKGFQWLVSCKSVEAYDEQRKRTTG